MPKLSLATKRKLEPWLLLAPAIICVVAYLIYPIIDNIYISFMDYSLIRPKDIKFNGLENYIKLYSSNDFKLVLKNSLVWVITIVSVQAIMGMILAVLLNRQFPGKNVVQSIVFTPWAVAGFLIGLIFRWIFNEQNGILNHVLMNMGLMDKPYAWLAEPSTVMIAPILGMIWYGIPFFAIMFLAALQSIPKETIEAAALDGVTPTQRFFKIDLAYIKPTIITTILLRCIWVFNSSDIIYVMTGGGPANSSSTLPLFAFQQSHGRLDFGYGAAISNTITVILLIYALIYLRATKYSEAGDF